MRCLGRIVMLSVDFEKMWRDDKSLAEFRKRMGEAHGDGILRAIALVHSYGTDFKNQDGLNCVLLGALTALYNEAVSGNQMSKSMNDVLASAERIRFASPPSPAEFRTDASTSGKKEPADTSQRNRPACSPSASKSAPPSPAPVESKPCPHSTCAAMHDAKGFHRPAAAPSSAAPDAGKEKA